MIGQQGFALAEHGVRGPVNRESNIFNQERKTINRATDLNQPGSRGPAQDGVQSCRTFDNGQWIDDDQHGECQRNVE